MVEYDIHQDHAQAHSCWHSGIQEPFELLAFISPRAIAVEG